MSTCTLISIVFYFANDSLPIFPLSILPRPRDHEVWGLNLKQNNWFKILFCPVVIYGAIWVGQLFLALIVCGCFYTFSVLTLLHTEFRTPRESKKQSSNTCNLLRTVRHLPREYNSVQLLHLRANGCVKYLMLVMHSECLHFILSCNVILLTSWNSLDIYAKMQMFLWSFVFEFWWTVWLEVVGRFYKMSKTTLNSWKNVKSISKHEKKCFMKYAKTCQPLTFGARGVFTINRVTVLKFTRSVVKGTFKAMLAFGRK
ncbi:hypothetical protein Fcan01_10485 [Folsomia candida]|uniref:Uncharacterized protein n=1 Tax=Folsomia candida TaxID=158441 RepID=A0A226EA54_FOLCA|nr:hypothetical protein Fcan01_10485 [Folsomia candida]